MEAEVSFLGGGRIRVRAKDLVAEAGPPPPEGGDPDAYGPFDLLLCALGICTGGAVTGFLAERGLPVAGAGLRIRAAQNEQTHLLENVSIEIRVPEGFPDKYNDAIVRAAGLCPVKTQLGLQPEMKVVVA